METKRPSLTQIAKDTGLTPSHVSKVLNGRPCRIDNAAKIAESMGITIDELYRQYIECGTWGIR